MMETSWFDQVSMMVLLKSYLDVTVFGILGLMSFFMLAYAVERVFFFARIEVSDYVDPHSLQVALTSHLTAIASIASNAPYIGLLGTVLGMIRVFTTISGTDVLFGKLNKNATISARSGRAVGSPPEKTTASNRPRRRSRKANTSGQAGSEGPSGAWRSALWQ